MTAPSSAKKKDELIAALESAVDETLAFFSGAGKGSKARIDRWGAREVLAHLPYWHYATAWGIASANRGGPPWQVSAGADEVNEAALAVHAGDSFDDLVQLLRELQERLVRVARQAQDIDATAYRLADGRTLTTAERLEMIARHWRSHLDALRQAGG